MPHNDNETEVKLTVTDIRQFEKRFTTLELKQDHLLEQVNDHFEMVPTKEEFKALLQQHSDDIGKKFLPVAECGGLCKGAPAGSFGAIVGKLFSVVGAGSVAGVVFTIIYYTITKWDYIVPLIQSTAK